MICLTNVFQNVSPAVRIDFVEVAKKADGFKACPIPLTKEQSTNVAVRRFLAFGKGKRKGVPIDPQRLAALIIDAFYERGLLWEAMKEDVLIALKYKYVCVRDIRLCDC